MEHQQKHLGWITAALLIGMVLSSLDQTILSTAMPTIVQQLGGFSLYSWAFTSYMLASTTSMPIYGKLADLFGRKRTYLSGLLLFLAGSVLCGLAGDMTQLILFRAVQGLGAGALMPIAFTIIGDLYPPDKIGKFQGLFGAVFALSSIVGPALGGLITEHGSWEWIFYMNLPLGAAAFFTLIVMMKEKKSGKQRSIDWLGAITLSGSVISLLLAMVLGGGGSQSWSFWQIAAMYGMGLLLLALFLWIETKAKDPLIPLSLFRLRVLSAGNVAGFFTSAAILGAIAYLPLFVQGVIGVSPSVSGYILTPMMLATVVSTTIGGRLMSRFSYRTLLAASLSLMAIGLLLLSQMSVSTTYYQITVYMVIAGLGMGAVYPIIGTAAVKAVDSPLRGVATSSSQFFRSMGGTVGVSILGAIMANRMSGGMNDLLAEGTVSVSDEQQLLLADPRVLLDSDIRSSLSEPLLLQLQALFSQALTLVFVTALAFVLISLAAAVFMGNARLVPWKKSGDTKPQ